MDHVLVFNERHARRLLAEYLRYYHDDPTHYALAKDSPRCRAVVERPSPRSKVVGTPRVRAAGATIALFGGFATAFTMLASSSVLWALAHPGVAQDRALVQALYWLDQGLGGSGFSVPFGLLIAGITIPAAILKLLPKWLVLSGIALAVIGELSWLNLIMPKALFLVPLTRFPGFVWLIAAGFALPTTIERVAPATTDRVVRGKVA